MPLTKSSSQDAYDSCIEKLKEFGNIDIHSIEYASEVDYEKAFQAIKAGKYVLTNRCTSSTTSFVIHQEEHYDPLNRYLLDSMRSKWLYGFLTSKNYKEIMVVFILANQWYSNDTSKILALLGEREKNYFIGGREVEDISAYCFLANYLQTNNFLSPPTDSELRELQKEYKKFEEIRAGFLTELCFFVKKDSPFFYSDK
ncbi:MAG: hypothetical protein QM652_00040 [Legionella sp.]|uniref:hypothetical protein n=1 Tax=Legionella sp. TaxID=459 RepID=UPI0039E6938F